jgi:integrase/recombinase XerD
MTPTVNIALDKSYIIKKGPEAGKHHIKIWVTFIKWIGGKKDWDQQPYKTELFATPDEFSALMENDPKKKTRIERLKEIRKKVDAQKARAEFIIEKFHVTDKKKFDLLFLSEHKPETLAGQYQIKTNELRNAKPLPKISSAENYQTSLSSLQEFFGEGVSFHDCTAERLQEYENWYIEQPRSKNSEEKKSLVSVGINMRALRHIFKRSIKQSIIPETLYPFGSDEDQYCIPEGEGDPTKEFLDTGEKDVFLQHRFTAYKCDNCDAFVRKQGKQFPLCPWCKQGSLLEIVDDRFNELHDYAVFSYFANGINAADIFRMRKSQLKPEYIAFNRQKTKGRKKKKAKLHTIPMHSRMQEIIWRRGNKTIGIPDDFVFPVLNVSMTEEEQFKAIRSKVHEIDRMLAKMAKDLKWDVTPTMYTLRHTFSNEYTQAGATTEELQAALAHGSIRTTETYKHGFKMERQKKLSEGLG